MTDNATPDSSKKDYKFSGRNYLYPTILSVGALLLTFFASNAGLSFQEKLIIFAVIVFLYIFFCVVYFRPPRQAETESPEIINNPVAETVFTTEVESKLLALEEANRFFGASLKSADMFRFVASRINEILPFAGCCLALADEEKSKLKFVYAVGENAENFTGLEIKSGQGLAGKTFISGKPQTDNQLIADKSALPADALRNFNAGIAVPLFEQTKCFGALILYGAEKNQFDGNSLRLLEAVAERAAALFLSSQTFEINLTNALTDALTGLPNERGFYLVAENQIAEAQRFRDERPLAILTIDIRNFDELNQKYGHATGDRLLIYAADTIKNQLRQMDFLARSTADEFLAVLPTASGQTTLEIIARIEKAFVSKPFEISVRKTVNLQLNFGAASFGKDGENIAQLLKHARLRKQQSKSDETGKILWFSKEYVN